MYVCFSFLLPPYGIGQAIIFLPCDFYLLSFLWPPYEIGSPLYFCPVVTIFLSFYLFSSPNLSSRRLDVWCGLSANLECMSEMCGTRLAGSTGRKKSPFWHHRTILSGHIFGIKACIDNRKKVVKQHYLLHMS